MYLQSAQYIYRLALCDLELAKKSDVKSTLSIGFWVYEASYTVLVNLSTISLSTLPCFDEQNFSCFRESAEFVFNLHFLVNASSLLAGISISKIAYPSGSINYNRVAKSDMVKVYSLRAEM